MTRTRGRWAPWIWAAMLVAAGVVDADTSSRDVDASVSIAEILRHLRALGDDAM